jgi:predicted Zn finger-like uncharacterized protein
MIIVCPKCSSRLQVDEMRIPSKPFTIRCPKCNSSVDANAPTEQTAVSIGASPSSENPRMEQQKAAPLFEPEIAPETGSAADKFMEMLSSLVNQPGSNGGYTPSARSSWNPRKALVCAMEENRESIARGLSESNYQVFVAQDSRQAVERMRENRLDLVILDSRFDPVEQGSVFVTREVTVLRPAQRRRLFFVLLSPTLRTLDAHAAFLNNVNMVVNVNDIAELPKLIEQRLREFNELYTEFNTAMHLPAL